MDDVVLSTRTDEREFEARQAGPGLALCLERGGYRLLFVREKDMCRITSLAVILRAVRIAVTIVGLLIPTPLSAQRGGASSSRNSIKHTLTLFVDDSDDTGHVFVLLSDGRNHLYRGLYPEEAQQYFAGRALPALFATGGEVRDDRNRNWLVRSEPFPIAKEGFAAALESIEATRSSEKHWTVFCHCGDFAEGVAQAAGVKFNLPPPPRIPPKTGHQCLASSSFGTMVASRIQNT